MGFPTNWQGPAPSCMEHAKPLRPPGNQGMRAAAHFLLESRFIHPDEAAFVQGLYMTFYMARLVERAAELMSLPTASTSLPTPPIVLQETHPRRVAILRIINLLFIVLLEEFRVIRLYSSAPRSKSRQSCRKAPCHSPFLPCVPKTLKKHAPKEKNAGRTFRPIRNHYYLLPR